MYPYNCHCSETRQNFRNVVFLSSHKTTRYHSVVYTPPPEEDMPNTGDIKASLATADHQGWFLMNGRPLVDLNLSESQQTNAGTLGLTTNLPDMRERLPKMTNETPLTSGGTYDITLQKGNLPVDTFSVTTQQNGWHNHLASTSSSGNHQHFMFHDNQATQYLVGTNNHVSVLWDIGGANASNYTMGNNPTPGPPTGLTHASGTHTHEMTVVHNGDHVHNLDFQLNAQQTPATNIQPYTSVKYFLYLS